MADDEQDGAVVPGVVDSLHRALEAAIEEQEAGEPKQEKKEGDEELEAGEPKQEKKEGDEELAADELADLADALGASGVTSSSNPTAVQMRPFLDAMDALSELTRAFGVALELARADIAEKAGVTREYWLRFLDERGSDDSDTVERLVREEIEQFCGKPASPSRKKKEKNKGKWTRAELEPLFAHARRSYRECPTRMIFRLLWAMEFSCCVLEQLRDLPDHSFYHCAGVAYNETLAHRHSWAIRAASKVAMLALPSRETVIARLECVDDPTRVYALAAAMRPVLTRIQTLFEELDLLEIP
jgi:Glycolipid transfer protein (GLTP)